MVVPVESKIKFKTILVIFVILFIVGVIILALLSQINREYKSILEIYPSEESFSVTVNKKTLTVKGTAELLLRPGDIKIQVSKSGYDNYEEIFKVQKSSNNKFIIDMRKKNQSINNLSAINGLKSEFIKTQNIVDQAYFDEVGIWAVITTQNKSNTNFAIFVALREGENWVLKYGPIFNPTGLKNRPDLPPIILNTLSGFAIEYFGERG